MNSQTLQINGRVWTRHTYDECRDVAWKTSGEGYAVTVRGDYSGFNAPGASFWHILYVDTSDPDRPRPESWNGGGGPLAGMDDADHDPPLDLLRAVTELLNARHKAKHDTGRFARLTLRQLDRESKALSAALKKNLAAQDFAYDLAINDGGQRLKQLQAAMESLHREQEQLQNRRRELLAPRPRIDEPGPESETAKACNPKGLQGTGVGLDWPVPLHARKELRRRGWEPLYAEDEAGRVEAWLCPDDQDYGPVITQVYHLSPDDEGPVVRAFTWPRPAATARPDSPPAPAIVVRRAAIEWSPDGHLQARDLDSGEIYVPTTPTTKHSAPLQPSLF